MGALSVNHERAFGELLQVDVIRGAHSTGMAAYNSFTGVVDMAKAVGPPSEVLRSSGYTKAMSKINRCLIGHNRYATKGKINEENAHPFKHQNIVGAHNGTLSYVAQKRLEDKEHEFGTDSEAIMWSIATRGFEETWKYIANPVYDQNAFALTWFNTKTDKFCLIRNKKRPLYYAYTEKEDAIFWASELGALQWIMYRNGFVGKEFKTFSVNEDTLYEWDIVKTSDELVSKPKMTKLDTPEPLYKASTQTHDNVTPWNVNSPSYNHASRQHTFAFTPKQISEQVTNFRQPYKTDKGVVIGKKFAMNLASQGCFYCGETNFKWGEFAHFPTFGAANQTEYLCKECYQDNMIRQIVMDCNNG